MTFIIPFKGRNRSGVYDVNFLYNENNIYVMDNHRLAMWCWLQHFNSKSENINFFHIDRHTDCLASNLSSWVSQSIYPTHVEAMSIIDYLSKIDSQFNSPLYRWDNYASIFLEIYKIKIAQCRFATYKEGDNPNHNNVLLVNTWMLPDNLHFYMNEGKWICNIDLDYFFYEYNNGYRLMYSEEYIENIFTAVKVLLDAGNISVLTVCFSPECCGSWSNSEEVWRIAQKCLSTNMLLP